MRIVHAIQQLFFERHFFALSRPSMSAKGSNLVEHQESNGDCVSDDPHRIEPLTGSQIPSEQKYHRPSEHQYFLQDDHSHQAVARIISLVKWIDQHRRSVAVNPLSGTWNDPTGAEHGESEDPEKGNQQRLDDKTDNHQAERRIGRSQQRLDDKTAIIRRP